MLFWCRWPLDEPLAVAWPPDASEAERALLARAFAAWQGVVPGLRFAPVAAGADAPLRLRFRSGGAESARTAAECRVEPPLDAAPLAARIVRAEVELQRDEHDAWGRPRRLGDAELLATAVHELGHALGLQGHPRGGDSVMRRDSDRLRRIGRQLLAGAALDEPLLAALYAAPSGRLLERRALASGATAALERRLGAAAVLEVRVGDRAARVRAADAPELAYYLKEPAKLAVGSLDFERSLWLP